MFIYNKSSFINVLIYVVYAGKLHLQHIYHEWLFWFFPLKRAFLHRTLRHKSHVTMDVLEAGFALAFVMLVFL